MHKKGEKGRHLGRESRERRGKTEDKQGVGKRKKTKREEKIKVKCEDRDNERGGDV